MPNIVLKCLKLQGESVPSMTPDSGHQVVKVRYPGCAPMQVNVVFIAMETKSPYDGYLTSYNNHHIFKNCAGKFEAKICNFYSSF